MGIRSKIAEMSPGTPPLARGIPGGRFGSVLKGKDGLRGKTCPARQHVAVSGRRAEAQGDERMSGGNESLDFRVASRSRRLLAWMR
jgi:hypothetical protein